MVSSVETTETIDGWMASFNMFKSTELSVMQCRLKILKSEFIWVQLSSLCPPVLCDTTIKARLSFISNLLSSISLTGQHSLAYDIAVVIQLEHNTLQWIDRDRLQHVRTGSSSLNLPHTPCLFWQLLLLCSHHQVSEYSPDSRKRQQLKFLVVYYTMITRPVINWARGSKTPATFEILIST